MQRARLLLPVLLLLVIHPSFPHEMTSRPQRTLHISATPLTIAYTSAQEDAIKQLFQDTRQTSAQLIKELMRALDTIDFSLHFWQLQLESSLPQIIAYSPQILLKPHYKQTIDEHLNHLKNEQEQIACNLGKLYRLRGTSAQLLSTEQQAEYAAQMLEICTAQQLSEPLTIESAYTLLTTVSGNIQQYQVELTHTLREHWAPNHFVRNWIKYATIPVATVAAATYLYLNRARLVELYTQTQQRLEHFWKEHIITMLNNAHDELFVNSYVPIGNPEVYEAKKEFAQNRVRTLLCRLRPSISQTPELLEKEIEDTLIGKGRIINEEWNNQAQKPLYNAIAGCLSQLVEARIIPYDLKTEQVAIAVDDIYKTLRTVIHLLGVTPVLLGSAGLIWGTKSLIQKLWPTAVDYGKVQHALRNLHILCVVHSSSRQCETDRYNGYLCYWLHKLMQALPSIPAQQRVPFKEDLKLLADHSLSCEQHLMVINRMYATYPFLKNYQ